MRAGQLLVPRARPGSLLTSQRRRSSLISQGEVYIQFDTVESAAKGVAGLNGRFFGGRSLVAHVRLSLLHTRSMSSLHD